MKTGIFAYIGSESAAVRTINTTIITLGRGVLDTVPVDHADETRIWFADGWQGIDRTDRVGECKTAALFEGAWMAIWQ